MKKKLIEVALPLEAINVASAREKAIKTGKPTSLHLWWARRPLAACRAVHYRQRPFVKEPDFGAVSVNYKLADLIGAGENVR